MRNSAILTLVIWLTAIGAFVAPGPGRGADAAARPSEAAAQDPRLAVPIRAAQSQRLRAEMRAHLEGVQGMIAALAADDWTAVAELAQVQAMGRGMLAADAPGVEFRQRLPPEWRNFGRPMHIDFAALADEARGAKRKDTALELLARATNRCTACHAAIRTEVVGIE